MSLSWNRAAVVVVVDVAAAVVVASAAAAAKSISYFHPTNKDVPV